MARRFAIVLEGQMVVNKESSRTRVEFLNRNKQLVLSVEDFPRELYYFEKCMETRNEE